MKVSNKDNDSQDQAPRGLLNREISWLEFNRRVLHEAIDERTPLLERVRFLGIFSSNLDEFFMKRVGGLKRQVAAKVGALSKDGLLPGQQLEAIRKLVVPMLAQADHCFEDTLKPALRECGVHLLATDELTRQEQSFARSYFRRNVFPVLTPMAVDPGHPFPFLSNLSNSLGVKLTGPDSDELLFARVKVPETLPTWIKLDSDSAGPGGRFVHLVQVISENLEWLFPGMEVLSVTPFRVTRNADIERDEEDAEDLLELVERELRERRFERMVRMEHGANADPWTVRFLMRELDLADDDVYAASSLLDYTHLYDIANLELPELKFVPWNPVVAPRLVDGDADIFSVIRAGDLLVHHPYESFPDSVERFIRSAAEDPRVIAIKLTLYRIGDNPAFIENLIKAAEAGKQVVCLVELKARFDEQRNIFWAQQLERAGVHVVYGIIGLKTHTKLTLVVRQDSDRLRSYVHIGTGNYNAQTARLYTDLGLFSCAAALGDEVVELFHYLTGRSLKTDYDHLLVAPVNMRRRWMELIENEVSNCRDGKPSGIVAKMNSLEDRKIIRALYNASQAGVPIDLIVRGFCCLRPGVEGLSENIRVSSVVGRFLEHSRIFYFRDGADDAWGGRYFIGSADWMYRNLDRRVELVTPVEDSHCRAKLRQILELTLDDKRQSWDLQPDGDYLQRTPTEEPQKISSQQCIMNVLAQRENRVLPGVSESPSTDDQSVRQG
ncbi:MAG: polyphosphate kinase 1 [Planctomycetota bacterium]|jgi:polyphosphate kinase